ncbi:hypothetical protein Ancab_016767 [Ancistrocladus abbreviatus]
MAVQAQLYSENLGFSAYGSQDWMANPGFGGFGDGFHSNQNQQQLFMNQLQTTSNQNLGLDVDDQSMTFSQSLAAEIEMQRREMDLYLQVQNVRLKYAIEQQRKRQMAVFLNRLESKATALVRQKEQDLAKVKEKTEQLEGCLRRAEMEIEEWQRVAKEKEAMVISLNHMLLQVKEKLLTAEAEAASESVNECEYSSTNNKNNNKGRRGEREKGKEKVEEIEEKKKTGCCKCCHSRSSCVVFLPCKHLCSCRFCETFLEICPVCQSVKEASVEVFLH